LRATSLGGGWNGAHRSGVRATPVWHHYAGDRGDLTGVNRFGAGLPWKTSATEH
jgi:hypothetical protein